MKQVTPLISAHVRSEVTTLCTCWRLERKDGAIYTWTDHDVDVTVDAEVYESVSSGGFDRTALESTLSLGVSNMELIGYLGPDLPVEQLRAGLFDNAMMRVMLVNWADPGSGVILMRAGTLGEVQVVNDDLFRVELRGLQQAYSQQVGEIYSPECRANFGDARCGIDLAQYTAQFAITGVIDRATFTVDRDPASVISAPPDMLDFGLVKFLSGDNDGATVETKSIVTVTGDEGPVTTVTLKFAAPNALAEGETLEIVAGCDQRAATCKAYGNFLNFRGEPYLPGEKAVFQIHGVG